MMKTVVLLIGLTISFEAFGQAKDMITINLETNKRYTIDTVSYDPLIEREMTDYFYGLFDNTYETLKNTPPTENVFSNSQFTRKRQASLDMDVNKFPIRTSVKLFYQSNNSLKNKCSGNFISRKHILTSAHCIAEVQSGKLLSDSLYICPALDNGEHNAFFDCGWVKKVFLFNKWDYWDDFAILELDKTIGDMTGWISIGFDNDPKSLLDGIYYKFSYPGISMPEIDPNSYNMDTLYYGYGIVDDCRERTLSIINTNAIPGESGSSLIKIKNGEQYTTFGTLSFSNDLLHCRIVPWVYYAMKSIIKRSLIPPTGIDMKDPDIFSVYPNPFKDRVQIKNTLGAVFQKIRIFDSTGKMVLHQELNEKIVDLDLSQLSKGLYLIQVESDKKTAVKKLIKVDE